MAHRLNWSTSGAAALALICSAGCASAPVKPLPAYLRASEPVVPRFPRSQFIAAVGTSTKTPEEAVQRARAGAVQQVSSQIQVEIEHWASEAQGTEASRFLEKIRSTSAFVHAELIRVAEQAELEGTFYALAILDRAEAEAALARDAAADESRFRAAADRALLARAEHKAGEFAVASSEAQAALPGVESSYVVRRAVLRGRSPSEAAHVQLRTSLIQALVEAHSRRFVDIRLALGENPALMQRAVAAVKRLGLRVAEGRGCDAQAEEARLDATELVLTPEESCGDGSFGPKCEVNIRLHARGCSGGGEGEGRIAQLRGAHTTDRERARAKAWEKVTDQVVESAVREALRGTLSSGGQP